MNNGNGEISRTKIQSVSSEETKKKHHAILVRDFNGNEMKRMEMKME